MVDKQITVDNLGDILDGIDENRFRGDDSIRQFLLSNATSISKVYLDESDWVEVQLAIEKNGGVKSTFREFRKIVNKIRRDGAVKAVESAYVVNDDEVRIYYRTQDFELKPVCDFVCSITKVVHPEYGDPLYTIEGETRSGYFECEIQAHQFEDDKKLRQVLGAATGESAVIHHRMGTHLAPAIKSLSGDDTQTVYLYNRTGWARDSFLIRGREPKGIRLDLTPETDYNLDGKGDMEICLESFCRLIESIGPMYTLPVIGSMLAPTIKRFMPKDQQRFQTFVVGETNSLKTSFCVAAMRMFKSDFNGRFPKFSDGSTPKGVMNTCTYAGDLPLMIDNYRPDGRFNAGRLQALIHMVTEGGSRLISSAANPNGVVETRPVSCQLIMTGEDFPVGSESAATRAILVDFPGRQGGLINEDLAYVQENGYHLSMIGWVWLNWIESEEGVKSIKDIVNRHNEIKQYWSNQLDGLKAVQERNFPVRRIADNLTYLSIVFECLRAHPEISEVMGKYDEQVTNKALFEVSQNIASGTSQSNEGSRFLDALKDLLDSGRAMVLPSQKDNMNGKDMEEYDLARCIGWKMDGVGDYGIIPTIAMNLIRRVLNEELNGISKKGLGRKLKGLEAIVTSGKGFTVQRRCGESRPSLFLIKKNFLESKE